MKKIIIFSILFLGFISVNGQKIGSKAISKKIKRSESELLQKEHYYLKLYERLRTEIDFIDLIRPNINSDTIFILESYDFSGLNRDLYIAVWNSRNKFFFTKKDTLSSVDPLYNKIDYDRMQLYLVENLYSEHMIQLVSRWDIEALKKEAEINGIIGSDTKIASRIIFKNRKYKIECITFDDFFNFKRDYTPFGDYPV